MISTREATKKYSKVGETKGNLPTVKMFILGIMAGLFIAIAGTGAAAASCTIGNAAVAKLINACIFPAGLAMVVLNGSELFTGNNLMVISLLDKRITLRKMLKNWIIVYLGSFVGSVVFSFLCAYAHEFALFDNKLALSLLGTAVTKCNISFADAVIKGIFCNILVCVAVFMTFMAESAASKIICLFFPITVFVICGFEHSVANMSYISGGIFIHQMYGDFGTNVDGLTWSNFIFGNLVPVTIGNTIGGSFMGVVYWYCNLYNPKKMVYNSKKA